MEARRVFIFQRPEVIGTDGACNERFAVLADVKIRPAVIKMGRESIGTG